MKNKHKAIFIAIILLFLSIVIYQAIKIQKQTNKNYIISTVLLDKLINETQKYMGVESEYEKFIHDLAEYCISNNNKDSINRYIEIAADYISPEIENDAALLECLNSENKELRKNSYRMLEYLMLNNCLVRKSALYYQFSGVGACVFSNAEFKKDQILSLGEDFESYILITASNFGNPMRVKIDGEKEILVEDDVYKYVKPSTTKGEKEVKGSITFFSNGRDHTLGFSQKYVVK